MFCFFRGKVLGQSVEGCGNSLFGDRCSLDKGKEFLVFFMGHFFAFMSFT